MSIYRILKYATLKEIRKITIIIITFSLIPLMISGILFVKDLSVEKNWIKTDAIVTDYNINDSKNNWTEIKYNYNGNIYNTKINNHSYYMVIGYEFEIYVNPTNPKEIKIVDYLYKLSKTLFIVFVSFIIILLLFVFPIYIQRKKNRN